MRIIWVPIVTAVLMLAFAAGVWINRSHPAEELPALTIDLPALHAGALPTPIPPHRSLDLRLDVTGVPPLNYYWAQINDPLGVKVWRATVNPQQSRAVARTLGLPPGIYNVQLTDDTGVLLRQYSMRVVHHK